MPKFLILQQLQQIKELVLTFNEQKLDALSLKEHRALILQRGDIQNIADAGQEQLLAIVNLLFPKWTIPPLTPKSPEKVNIAYILRILNVARSTFYRFIDKSSSNVRA